MVVVILVILILLLLLGYKVWTNHNNRATLPPGPKGWPIVGNVFEIDFQRLQKTLLEWKHVYGHLVYFPLLGNNILVLNTADILDEFCTKEPNATICAERSGTYVGKHVMFGYKDIGFAKYTKEVHALRKMVKAYSNDVGSKAELLDKTTAVGLKRTIDKLHELKGNSFVCQDVIMRTTCNFFSELIVGENYEYDDPKLKTLMSFSETFNVIMLPQVNALLVNFPIIKYIPGKYKRLIRSLMATRDTFLSIFVQKHKETFDSKHIRGMVDHLISEHRKTQVDGGDTWMTHEHVMAVTMDIIVAGVDSTLAIISGMILFLLHRPDVQKKLQDEIDRVVGTEMLPCANDRNNMTYFNAFILECMRYSPVGPLGVPGRTTKDTTFMGYFIPKNTTIIRNVWAITHDDTIWENPWEFNPDRFLAADGELLSQGELTKLKFHPFGVGKRTCVGENFAKNRIFLCIATILQSFTLVTAHGESIPSMDPRTFVGTVTLGPANFKCTAIAR